MKQSFLVAVLVIVMAALIYRLLQTSPFSGHRAKRVPAAKGVQAGAEPDFPPAGNGLLISKLF